MAETFNQMIRFPKDLEPQIKAQAEKKRKKFISKVWNEYKEKRS